MRPANATAGNIATHPAALGQADVVSMVFTKIRYLLDSESTRLTTKAATLPQLKYYANSTSKTWGNSLEWELLLPLYKMVVEN